MNGPEPPSEQPIQAGQRHSVFSPKQKTVIVILASIAAFFSPLSANIYFPALNTIAHDLNVSNSRINLTVTTYLVFFLFLNEHHAIKTKSTNKILDFSRFSANIYGSVLGQRREETSLHSKLHHLHRCQCRAGLAKQLCCAFGASLHSEFW